MEKGRSSGVLKTEKAVDDHPVCAYYAFAHRQFAEAICVSLGTSDPIVPHFPYCLSRHPG